MRKKVKKRLLSLLLCGAMVFSLCPPAAAAVKDAEYDDPKILAQTGTREADGEAGSLASASDADKPVLLTNEKSLKKQTKSEPVEYNGPEVVIGAEQIPAGSYVYFGADYTPYKWRVLDNEANERLFLLSDVGFYPKTSISQGTAWGNSALRQRMLELIATDPGLEKKVGIFDKAELAAIDNTNNRDTNTSDKLFALSIEEAMNSNYFPGGNADRATKEGWWLRTSGNKSGTYAYVDSDGSIHEEGMSPLDDNKHVMPALNLDPEAVLFAANADWTVFENMPSYSFAPGEWFFGEVGEETFDSWRLILREPGAVFNASISSGNQISYYGVFPEQLYPGVSLTQTVAAMLTDEQGNVCYSTLLGYFDSKYSSEDHQGKLSFDSYGIEAGDYTMKVFIMVVPKNLNAKQVSAYASNVVDIPISVGTDGTIFTMKYPEHIQWDPSTPGRITWDAVEGAVGYWLQLYTEESGRKSTVGDQVFVDGKNNTSYTFELEDPSLNYVVGIRAVDGNNGESKEVFSEGTRGEITAQSVMVNFDSNGGIPNIYATVVVMAGSKIESPSPNPTKEGYTFVGWKYNGTELWNFDDPVTADMTLTAAWTPAGEEKPLSQNTALSSVTVDGTKGTISGTKISVVLPRGSKIPTSASAVKITTKDDGALVMDLKTNNSGKTWTFTVMAEDGTTTEDYTITVTVKSSSSGGSSGGGSSSGGSGGGGGGASSSSRRPSSTSSTKKPSLPAYVVSGTWSQNGEGQWRFTDGSGTIYKGRWAAVENPYANTALGQSGYDWFRFDADGNMVTGWFQDSDGNWYYLNPNSDGTRGRMLTGWFQDVDGSWYYLNPNSDGTRGRMMTGWNWIKDGDGVTRCYYLNPNADGTRGKMAVNTTVENYTLDAEGHWIVDGVIQTR